MKARSRSSLGFRGNEQQEENSSGLGLHVLSDVAKLLSGRGGEHTVGEGQAMLYSSVDSDFRMCKRSLSRSDFRIADFQNRWSPTG